METLRPEKRKFRLALLLLLTAAFAMPAPWAMADEDDKEEQKSYTVNKWAYKRLNEAHALIGQNKYKEALEIMEDMKGRRRLNPYERALTWQTVGYIWSARENFPKAIQAFEKCLAFKALPDAASKDTRFNLGQLYLANKQYKMAIRTLSEWMASVNNPAPKAKYMLAMAYVQASNYKSALYWVKSAIAGVRKPQEAWLQMQMSCHFKLKQMAQVAKVLERLVTLYPRRNYWLQLSAVYHEIKQVEKSLAVLELAYLQGFLKSKAEVTNFAQMLAYHGIPTRAAEVLEKGMKDGIIKRDVRSLRLLGDSWLRAREYIKAVGPLSQAAEKDQKGDLWVQVAQIYLEREEWKKAGQALSKALQKGNLTDTGNAHLLLGIAHFRGNQPKAAKKAFDQAKQFKNTKRSAEQWIKVMGQKRG
jgi:hypothetical protein